MMPRRNAGWSRLAARRPHNPKAADSDPTPRYQAAGARHLFQSQGWIAVDGGPTTSRSHQQKEDSAKKHRTAGLAHRALPVAKPTTYSKCGSVPPTSGPKERPVLPRGAQHTSTHRNRRLERADVSVMQVPKQGLHTNADLCWYSGDRESQAGGTKRARGQRVQNSHFGTGSRTIKYLAMLRRREEPSRGFGLWPFH